MKKNIITYVNAALLAGFLVIGVSYISAWTGPSSAAPMNNVSAPINVGSSTQTKLGPLVVNFGNLLGPGLEVLGGIQIVDGTQGAGKVLTSDASGNASWVTSIGSGGAGNMSFVGYYTTPVMTVIAPVGATNLIIIPTADISCSLPNDVGSGVGLGFYANNSLYATLRTAASNNNGGYTHIGGSTTGVVPVTGGESVSLTITKNTYGAGDSIANTAQWPNGVTCPSGAAMGATFNGYTILAS